MFTSSEEEEKKKSHFRHPSVTTLLNTKAKISYFIYRYMYIHALLYNYKLDKDFSDEVYTDINDQLPSMEMFNHILSQEYVHLIQFQNTSLSW